MILGHAGQLHPPALSFVCGCSPGPSPSPQLPPWAGHLFTVHTQVSILKKIAASHHRQARSINRAEHYTCSSQASTEPQARRRGQLEGCSHKALPNLIKSRRSQEPFSIKDASSSAQTPADPCGVSASTQKVCSSTQPSFYFLCCSFSALVPGFSSFPFFIRKPHA